MIIDVLAVASLPWDDYRSVPGSQGRDDCADAGVAYDALCPRHGVDYILEGHELNPCRIGHFWPGCGAPVLDYEMRTLTG